MPLDLAELTQGLHRLGRDRWLVLSRLHRVWMPGIQLVDLSAPRPHALRLLGGRDEAGRMYATRITPEGLERDAVEPAPHLIPDLGDEITVMALIGVTTTVAKEHAKGADVRDLGTRLVRASCPADAVEVLAFWWKRRTVPPVYLFQVTPIAVDPWEAARLDVLAPGWGSE